MANASTGPTVVRGTHSIVEPTVAARPVESAQSEDPYEQRLRQDPGWAMSESSRYFEGSGKLQETLREFTKRLDERGIAYAVVGGMALAAHGYVRMTEDIDLLVTREALKRLHGELVGRGYKLEFAGARNLRDTATGVKIEFVLSGAYPGSGEVQPVRFPDPADTEPVVLDRVKFVGLGSLIELKLASGMTGGADRAKDLVDVQQLITFLKLPRTLSVQLHEYVRAKYEDLWDALRVNPKKYLRIWRNKFLTVGAKSLDDMIAMLGSAADELRKMQADGVVLDPQGGAVDDCVHLVTGDPEVARKYDLHEASEFFGDDDDDGDKGSTHRPGA